MLLDVVKELGSPVSWKSVIWRGQDVEAVIREMQDTGARAIRLEADRDADLSWLPHVPGLARVQSMDPIRRDEAVWDIATLESTILANSSKSAARVDRVSLLNSLEVDWRRGLETVSNHDALERLSVWSVAANDLSWLQAGPSLWEVNLTGRRSKKLLDVSGTDFAKVKALQLTQFKTGDVSALRTARSLRGLCLDGVDIISTEAQVELIEILGCLPLLEQVAIFHCDGVDRRLARAALPPNATVTITPDA